MNAPGIPLCLAHRPVQAGVAVPWFVITLPDGTVDFAACEGLKVNRAMLEGICGVCGQRITSPRTVFFAGDDQLDDLLLDALPMHPECATYAARACPMVAGRLATYRASDTRAHTTHQACDRPGCDCGGFSRSEDDSGRGRPAPEWFAVWCADYTRVASSQAVVDSIRAGRPVPGERILAKVERPLRVRRVTRPS